MTPRESVLVRVAADRLEGRDPLAINDLRLRVLHGEDISAEEMLSIVDQIRQNRRSAARAPAKPKAAKPSRTTLSESERESLLSGEI